MGKACDGMHICLYCSCWDETPEKRPKIDELVSKFTKLSKVSASMFVIVLFYLHIKFYWLPEDVHLRNVCL